MLSALRIGTRGALRAWSHSSIIICPKKIKSIHMPAFAIRGMSSNTDEYITVATTVQEPTLASLGLATDTPAGLVRSSLEYLHVAYDIPWWGTIVIGTVCVRLLIFPLVVKVRRDGAHLNNNMPKMMEYQNKILQARTNMDHESASKYSIELTNFMKENRVNPFKTLIAPIVQFPFFLSFFVGLRSMANLPVESMKHGGILWFTDLTIPDPMYLLPIITSATLYVTILMGADTGRVPEQMMKVMKVLPIIMIPFTLQFPAAILCYWTTTNFISLLQVTILNVPSVQRYFNIPKMIDVPKTTGPFGGNFMKDTKEAFVNLKVAKELEERRALDELINRKKEESERRRREVMKK